LVIYTRQLISVWPYGGGGDEGWIRLRNGLYFYPNNFGVTNKVNAGPSGCEGLGRRSAAARLLRSWVRIPPGAWMFVCCECCVLSGRGLCDELITLPEESYRLCCVVVCDLETSRMGAAYIYDSSHLRVNFIRKHFLQICL
jgi:hypothetical protein